MKTRRRSLLKRGLSFFIAMTMCLSMLQMPVFAAEAHEHNQDGWECVWVEGSKKLDCKHEHGEECYRPGKDVLDCEEDHHTEDCYAPGEDVLICEDESEEHEHTEDCYIPGEDVLKCKESHHTEDCYIPGEDELNCTHEHDEDCYIVTEGRWECTVPEKKDADETDEVKSDTSDTAETDEPSVEMDAVAGDKLTAEPEKEDVEPEDKSAVSDKKTAAEETEGIDETPKAKVSVDQTDTMQEDEPDYVTVDDLEAAFMAVGEILEDGDVQAGIAALDEYLDIYSRLSPEDQKANAEAQKAALAYRETLKGSLEGIEDPDIEQTNTYDEITVNYVVNGVTLRTDTLTSGRYIQIKNQVPYVSDLIRGTQYADYDYGTVTKIECRPLQYFPPSALTLREGQNIEHSGNYKTHTITYITSKWEKHQTVTPPADGGNGGGNNGDDTISIDGNGKYSWTQTLIYHANYPGGNDPKVTVTYKARGGFGNMTVTTITPKTFDGCGFTLPEGYSLEKNSWYSQSSGGNTLCSMGGSFSLNYNNRNTTTHLYAHYKNDNPVSYSYQLTWDYNGGTLNGEPFTQENAMNLEGDANATYTFYEQENKRPSRDGYEFDGWTYSGNGSFTESNGQIKMIGSAGNTVTGTMTAKWKLDTTSNIKVTLRYDANQGQNPPASQEVAVGGDAIVAGKGDMTRDGYTFLGWSTKVNPDADDVNTQPGDTLHMETDVTLYAVWSENPSYTVKWYDTEENEIKASEIRSDTAVGKTVSVTEDDKKVAEYTFDADNPKNKLSDTLAASGTVLVLYFTKNQISPPQPTTPKLEVTKNNTGFKINSNTGNAIVKYTITVTNKSGFAIYGLRITDTLDQPTVTKVNSDDVGEAKIKWSFENFKVKVRDGGTFTNIAPQKGGENDLEHVLQPLARGEEFADEQTVTLTYTIEIENLNDDVAVKVGLDNTAVGASWSKAPTDKQASLFRMSRSIAVPFADDDPPDIIDSDSSSASSGEIGDSGSSSTEGELPRKYSVTYTWNLPEDAKEILPAEPNRPEGATVKVDTKYTNTTKIEVNGKTYTFSGWNTTDAKVTDDEFTMPAGNVTIRGIWTEKKGEKPDIPDVPDPEEITVTWLPGYGSNTPIQTKNYDKGTTEVPERDYPENPVRDSYTFNGWSDPVIDADGNITITAQWTPVVPDTPETPDREKITATWLPGYGNNEPIQTEEYDKGIREIPATDYPENPVREGYTFDGWNAPVRDGEGNITITAKWKPAGTISTPESHKVTIHYTYADGSKAADDAVRDNLAEGTVYSITSPSINGYTPDQAVVNGTMGTGDVEITVIYTQNSSNNPDNGSGTESNPGNEGSGNGPGDGGNSNGSGDGGSGSSSGGRGSGGGGGSSATNLSGRVHGTTPSPETAVTVPGDGVPLADVPAGNIPEGTGADIPDEDVPLAGIPLADIPDADVPLSGFTGLTGIPDEDVPLASVPKTGDHSGLWHMMALLSAFSLMAMTMMDKKKRQEKEQES